MNSMLSTLANNITTANAVPVLILTSFTGGIIASTSPCSLSMLPVVIGYIGGYGNKNNLKTFIQLVSFIFGSAIIFSVIGIICALTGQVFISYFGNYFLIIVAGVLMLMGLNLTGLITLNIPVFINKIPNSKGNSVILYPMLLGAVFAIGGTPCSTPILAGIMGVASSVNNIILSVMMLFSFSLGQGLILLCAGMFTSAIKRFDKIYGYSNILLKISGIILILISILFYYKIFSPFLN